MQLFDDIREVLSMGDTKEGLSLLKKRIKVIGNSDFEEDIISLTNQYFHWEKENLQGLNSSTDPRNRIIKALLACMNEFEQGKKEGRAYRSFGELDSKHIVEKGNNRRTMGESNIANKRERRIYHILVPLLVALIGFIGITHEQWLSCNPIPSNKLALNLYITYPNGMPFTGTVDIIADGFSKPLNLNIENGKVKEGEAVLPDTRGIEMGQIKIVGEALYLINPQFVHLDNRLQEFQVLYDKRDLLRPTIRVYQNHKNKAFVNNMWLQTSATNETYFEIKNGLVIFSATTGIDRKYEKSNIQLMLLSKDRGAVKKDITIELVENEIYEIYLEEVTTSVRNTPKPNQPPRKENDEKGDEQEGVEEELVEVTLHYQRKEKPQIFVDGKLAREKFNHGINIEIMINKGQHEIELRWEDEICKVKNSYFEGGELIMQSDLECN